MPSLTGSELLVKALESEGAERVFSIPGGQLIGVYEAIRKSPKIDLVVPRQEGAGALMACGHALAQGKPGVVISTVGAGVIYEIPGLAYAWLERIPLISIAPQVQSWRIKPTQENLQALDQDELYSPITKFHSIAYHVRRIPQLVSKAFKVATMPEPGPVHLDIPLDIAFEKKSFTPHQLEKLMPGAEKTRFMGKVGADPSELEKARKLIAGSKRPIALIGRMAARPSCVKALEMFLTRARIPALSSQTGFSALPHKNRLYLSTSDILNNEESYNIFSEADLVFYIEPDEEIAMFAQGIAARSGPGPAIQLSSQPELFQSFAPVSAALAGSPELALEELARDIQPKEDAEKSQWLDKLLQNCSRAFEQARVLLERPKRQSLPHTVRILNRFLKEDDFVVCEGKDAALAAKLDLENYAAGRVILLSENAPRGSGFPLALGIRSGARGGRVFLLTDRRNFKYHCRELQTASRYCFGICSLVFPDVGPDQRPLSETEPDFARLAESLGVKGHSIQDPTVGFNERLLKEACEEKSGSLLEFRSI